MYSIWSHFQELIRIDRKEEREFYDHQIILASVYKFDEIKRTVIEMKL